MRWTRASSAPSSRGRALAAAGVAAALAALAPAPGPAAAATVAAVELRADAPIERPGDVAALIALEPGDELTREAVVRSLRNLHAAGVAEEIEVFTLETGEGVRAVFALWTRIQVVEVRIAGETGLKPAELRRALVQGAAQPMVEDRVIRGVFRLQDLYRDRGYREATVRVQVEVDAESKQAVVTYHVASGEQATVGAVSFEGDLGPFTPQEVTTVLRAPPGSRYRRSAVENDAERLEWWLFQRGHRQVVVDRPTESYRQEERLMDLVYPVEAGPRFEFVVEGAEVEELRKRKLPPFASRDRYDEALALRTEAALRRYFQQKGHYQVEVEWSEERAPGEVTVHLRIEPGPVLALRNLDLSGNQSFSADRLAALMETSAKRLVGGARLVDEVLEADLANLRSFYALQGFVETEVGPARIEVAGGGIEVAVPIVEGRRRSVAQLELTGVESIPPEDLLRGLPLTAGGPFHPRLLEESLDGIRARYEQRGYSSARVSASLEWNETETLAAVSIRVLEGPRSEVDRIILRGNSHTRGEVIRRSLGLRSGDALSTGRLLEAQRELYALGIFSRIDVGLAPGRPFAGERDLVVRVEEGKRNQVTYGLGYDSEDGARGLFGYSYSNLFGRAVSLRLDLRASQREQQYRALVRQPFVGRWRLPVTYSMFSIEERKESFDSDRLGTQVEARKIFGTHRLGLLFTYKRVEVTSRDEALRDIEIDRNLRQVEVASLTPSLLIDRRDDPVDPTRGWSSNLQVESAFPLFAAENRFFKLFGQQTAYLSLRRLGVLAASLRLGAIEPAGPRRLTDPTVPAGLPSAHIPISERFFAGGRTTHRAYVRDGLGIPGETLLAVVDPDDPAAPPRLVPLGGNALALLNLDYRFPIAGPVGGTVFLDAGNVWADWQDVDPGEAKLGAGLGVRYRSPIGPVRLDVGWKLDREPSENSFVVHFSFGNPF